MGTNPAGRPFLTTLFPLSDKAVVSQLFKGAGGEDALLGTVPADERGTGKGKGMSALGLPPRRLEATLSVLDLSGEEPKAAFLLGGSCYKADDYAFVPGLLRPDGGRDAFDNNSTVDMGFDSGYWHQLELFVQEEEAEQQGRAVHVRFGVTVMHLYCDKAGVMDMGAQESWKWMDGTWSKLAWK